MTELVIEPEEAPQQVQDDADTIADETIADEVTVESAVDLSWFIRVEGDGGLTRESFNSMADMIEGNISGGQQSVERFYDNRDKYLILIRY